ncbi:M18 family aminopeptidase [Corynebacterium caspium]|uniref:M18 family aminopeptidase n=1 Tax=Corynebacterium caspium TaxID=234828 RepID=UPI0003607C9C|nr:M18 family aminopeptidase [Corynebacterium caspium]WKD59291.1 putative M18 family aminopeptidase 2 [Corynebacterium caspium DSM 44850]
MALQNLAKHSQDLIDFIAASPSSYHAAFNVGQRCLELGFQPQDETKPWDARPGGHFLIRSGAVVAWYIPPTAGPQSAFRIIGSHTDSPGLMVKPQPEFSQAGFQQLAVEVYGGPILHSWFDRELTVAGQLVLHDGSTRLANTGPVGRIPNLAIHLYRQDEFTADRQTHLQPVLCTTAKNGSFMQLVADSAGVSPTDIAAFNLITADAQRGEIFGAKSEFLAAGRLDNLSSVFASLEALSLAVADYEGQNILVMAAFDHEEVGSASRTGAGGPLLSDVLQRTARALGADEEQRYQMLARSSCVSADAAHSVHPNYSAKHDPTHHPVLGGGVVLKINANQRYASEATTAAIWRKACAEAAVPVQDFVSNNAVPCGSTIGPITATRLGIPTVDVGVPLLSMHSAREMLALQDELWFSQALHAYLLS